MKMQLFPRDDWMIKFPVWYEKVLRIVWVETKLAYIVWVRGLSFSCDGLMSISFCCGITDVLVDL